MILTVDDFGFHEAANALVERAIEARFVTHVSTMVNLPASAAALEFLGRYRRDHPANDTELVFGLHLNLTEGRPVGDPATVRSLIDRDGQFIGWAKLIGRALTGQLDRAELERETDAQIRALISTGAKYLFVNSHHHVHFWPSIARAIAPVVRRHGIHLVRQPSRFWWPALRQRYGFKGVLIETVGLTHWQFDERLSDQFVDFDWVDPSDEARTAALSGVPPEAELSCHPHLYTTPRDPDHTPRPISSLEWLMKQPLNAGRS